MRVFMAPRPMQAVMAPQAPSWGLDCLCWSSPAAATGLCDDIGAKTNEHASPAGLGANVSGVPMAHVLGAIRHAKTSFYIYWPAAVIAASLAWTFFLGYAAVALVKDFTH
jgi:hypothetical protein